MAATQTSVSDRMTAAFAGMLADSSYVKNVRSYVNEEASAEIPFGVMVKQGTAANDAKACASGDTSPVFIGVTVHSHAYAKPTEVGDTGVKPNMTLGVLTRGCIWVPVEEAVTPASAVLVRIIATGSEVAGAFRDTADASDCIDISGWARFVSTTTGAGFAQLEFDVANRSEKAAD